MHRLTAVPNKSGRIPLMESLRKWLSPSHGQACYCQMCRSRRAGP